MPSSKGQKYICSERLEDDNLMYVEFAELKFGRTKVICQSKNCDKTDCIYNQDVLENPHRKRTLTPVLFPAKSSID